MLNISMFQNSGFHMLSDENWGLGACPQKKFLKVTPSRTSENALLQNIM